MRQSSNYRFKCPFGAQNGENGEAFRACNGKGFLDVSQLNEHLKNHLRAEPERRSNISAWVKENKKLSRAEKWRGIDKIIFPNATTIPAPFLPSPDEYREGVRQPNPAVLKRMRAKIDNGEDREPRDDWKHLTEEEKDKHLSRILPYVESYMDGVDEEGPALPGAERLPSPGYSCDSYSESSSSHNPPSNDEDAAGTPYSLYLDYEAFPDGK